jgi:hypothetical protein
MTETSKEADLAAEVAAEKKQELKDLEQKVHVAEKALDSARTEAEAVSEMVDKKKNISEAAESELQNMTKKATDMAKIAKEKKQGEHAEEKQGAPTDQKKEYAMPAKVSEKKTVATNAAPEQAVTDKKSTQSADVDTKLAALKTENERLKQEKERLAKQLQAQELERQNEKLAKEKEELEKKVQSKTSDGDKKNQSDAPAAHGFGASPSAAPPKLKLHKSLKKHLG